MEEHLLLLKSEIENVKGVCDSSFTGPNNVIVSGRYKYEWNNKCYAEDMGVIMCYGCLVLLRVTSIVNRCGNLFLQLTFHINYILFIRTYIKYILVYLFTLNW